jgi:hypothetical protein
MVFLFKLETILAEMTVVDNLLANQKLMFSLNLQKINRAEKKIGDNFLVTNQGIN